MIYGPGMLESGITFDFGQLVLDCEFIRMIKHTLGGVPVTDETLAVDPIKAVGIGGDHLMQPLTLAHMKSQSKPELIDRKMRAVWEKNGATTAYDRAMEKVRYNLETHQPAPLPAGVREQIRNIVVQTEAELGITHRQD